MLNFYEFIDLLNEGINKQLVVAQMSKKWKQERVLPQEIDQRIKNSSSDQKSNIDYIIELIVKSDPTSNKEYFAWLLSQYVNNKIRLPEDSPVLHQDLEFFTNVKKSGALKRVANTLSAKLDLKSPLDITSYDRYKLQSLVDEMKKVGGESNRQKIAQIKHEGAKTIYHDEEWEVVEIESGEAACYYARGTRWCTSSKTTAEHYLRRGPLYIIYHEGQPFAQIHFESK